MWDSWVGITKAVFVLPCQHHGDRGSHPEKKICKKCLCGLDKWTSLGWAGQQLRKRPTSMSTSRWDVTDSRWHIRIAALWVARCRRFGIAFASMKLKQFCYWPRPKHWTFLPPSPAANRANSRTREVRGRDCGNKVLKLGATATRRVCQAGLARVRGESKESHD